MEKISTGSVKSREKEKFLSTTIGSNPREFSTIIENFSTEKAELSTK
jgi:hypothetical protein